jgi:hypothetical protein
VPSSARDYAAVGKGQAESLGRLLARLVAVNAELAILRALLDRA